MKIRDIIVMLEDDGWYIVATRGSHRQYKHPAKPGRVTIAGHPDHDISPGTLRYLEARELKREVRCIDT